MSRELPIVEVLVLLLEVQLWREREFMELPILHILLLNKSVKELPDWVLT